MNDNPQSEQIDTIKKWLGAGSINIFGPPFSGKDTQGQRLAKLFDAELIGGGDILRSRDDTPKYVIETIDGGVLAPSKDYLKMVLPYFKQEVFAQKSLVLNSVGRWHGEETSVLKATEKAGHPLKAVVYIRFPEEKIWERREIAHKKKDRGGRVDDSGEILKTRLEEYRTKTLPVIDFYRSLELLIETEGNAPIDYITNEILRSLVNFSNFSRV